MGLSMAMRPSIGSAAGAASAGGATAAAGAATGAATGCSGLRGHHDRCLLRTRAAQSHRLLLVSKIQFSQVVGDHQTDQFLELSNINHVRFLEMLKDTPTGRRQGVPGESVPRWRGDVRLNASIMARSCSNVNHSGPTVRGSSRRATGASSSVLRTKGAAEELVGRARPCLTLSARARPTEWTCHAPSERRLGLGLKDCERRRLWHLRSDSGLECGREGRIIRHGARFDRRRH